MVLNLANRQAYPTILENPKKVGKFIQDGNIVDFYNGFSSSIICGEPIIMYNKVGITKQVVLPKTCGSIHFGCWAWFLMNPAHVSNILWGQKMFYSLDLAVANVTPGYVTPTQPTNGFFLGWATCMHASPTEIELDASLGRPIAWKPGQEYIPIKMHDEEMKWGTNFWGNVPDYINFDAVISS